MIKVIPALLLLPSMIGSHSRLMKRKLSTPSTNQVKKQSRTMKMKNDDTTIDNMEISSIDLKSKTFQFKLTEKTATKNLLKSASRIPIECDEKQLCTMVKFSAGAYIQAVKPTILFWKSQLGKRFNYGKFDIKVVYNSSQCTQCK